MVKTVTVVCCQELKHGELKLYSVSGGFLSDVCYPLVVCVGASLQQYTALSMMSALRAGVFGFPRGHMEREFAAIQTLTELYLLTCRKA